MLSRACQSTPQPQPQFLPSVPAASDEAGFTYLSHRVLDQLQVAIVILDTNGVPLFCNIRARQLARNPDRVEVHDGRRLRFLDATADKKFQSFMRQFARLESTEDPSVTIVANGLGSQDWPLIGTLRLLPGTPRTVLATLVDSGCPPSETRLQCFMLAFRLTPAELRLTRCLASGARLGDAAKSFGVFAAYRAQSIALDL